MVTAQVLVEVQHVKDCKYLLLYVTAYLLSLMLRSDL